MQNILRQAKGSGGQLVLLKNKVIIKRNGIIAFFLFGSKKDKGVLLERIFSIQFKKASITSGYIRFLIKGEIKGNLKYVKPRYGDLVRDENVILFNIFQQPYFQKIKEMIEDRIVKREPGGMVGKKLVEIQKMDKLMHKGIISKEDFRRKKKRILGIKE